MKGILKFIVFCIVAWLIWTLLVFIWSTIFVKKTTDVMIDTGKEIVNTIQEEANNGDITLAEFNQIKVGMTYDQVVNIIGVEGTVSSETQIAGSNHKYYVWNGVGLGAAATICFENNIVYSKTQVNLK